jgi:hypothetical protein
MIGDFLTGTLGNHGHKQPAPRDEVGWSKIDAIACALAEEFGVSESFMGVRFRKYRLVC